MLKWVKEIPVADRRGVSISVAGLAERPGQWAILREYARAQSAYPTATRLNQRYGPQGYEFVARANGDGGKLYGRKIKK